VKLTSFNACGIGQKELHLLESLLIR